MYAFALLSPVRLILHVFCLADIKMPEALRLRALLEVFARLFQKAARVEGAKPSLLVATSKIPDTPFFGSFLRLHSQKRTERVCSHKILTEGGNITGVTRRDSRYAFF
jgi:hypothetical protein